MSAGSSELALCICAVATPVSSSTVDIVTVRHNVQVTSWIEGSLGKLKCAAKIDYITIHTPGRTKLPPMDGKAIWSRKHHGKRLTVHDTTAADIDALVATFGNARLIELEVAIDIRPPRGTPPEQCDAIVKAVMVDIFARGLEPSAGSSMVPGFRAFYRRLDKGYLVRPFNLGLPRATDQLLHGGRNDAAQVKGYWKRRDQGAPLAPEKQSARIEVRLGSEGLFGHDLLNLTDLNGFRFRKKLMPYFWHVRGTARLKPASLKARTPLMAVLSAKSDEYDQAAFNQAGVGAFGRDGKRSQSAARLLRNTPVNNRLGQALLRLERQFHKNKFVRADLSEFWGNPGPMRFRADMRQSRMTI